MAGHCISISITFLGDTDLLVLVIWGLCTWATVVFEMITILVTLPLLWLVRVASIAGPDTCIHMGHIDVFAGLLLCVCSLCFTFSPTHG